MSDADLTVHRLYGAYGEKKLYGKVYEGVIRSTFVIDGDGVIRVARIHPRYSNHERFLGILVQAGSHGGAHRAAKAAELVYCEVVEGRTLCNWGEAFKSIVGNGTASIIDNLDEARQGLALLMKQQAGMEHVEFTDQQVRAVTVWKVEADYFTAKVREKPQPHMH